MNTSRLINLFLLHFRANTRNKVSIMLSIIFPLFFIGLFGLTFANGSGTTPIQLGVLNMDKGLPESVINSGMPSDYMTNIFLNTFSDITFDDNSTSMFSIQVIDPSNFEDKLRDVEKQDLSVIMVIPENYSEVAWSILSDVSTESEILDPHTQVELIGDPTTVEFSVASAVIQNVIDELFTPPNSNMGISIAISPTTDTEEVGFFTLLVPGLVVFAILTSMTTVCSAALGDIQNGNLSRLRLTKMAPKEYLSGLIVSQMVISMLQIPILFGTATLFGFPLNERIIYAFMFSILLSLAVSGIGLLVAAVLKDVNSAGGLSALVSTPMAFLAGAFIPISSPVVIQAGSIFGTNDLALFDLLPATPVLTGLRLLLVHGRGIGEVWFELVLSAFLAAFYLILGIWVYSKKHLQPK